MKNNILEYYKNERNAKYSILNILSVYDIMTLYNEFYLSLINQFCFVCHMHCEQALVFVTLTYTVNVHISTFTNIADVDK